MTPRSTQPQAENGRDGKEGRQFPHPQLKNPFEEGNGDFAFRSFHPSGIVSISALMERCRALDVLLWVEDGGLRFDAPSGALDDELRAELRANKAGLIAALAPKGETAAAADQPEQVPAEAGPTAWPPRDPRLAGWPLDKRERWGRRANALEDEGLSWKEAERQAFLEVLAENEPVAQVAERPRLYQPPAAASDPSPVRSVAGQSKLSLLS